jgi:hypothetical protein
MTWVMAPALLWWRLVTKLKDAERMPKKDWLQRL